MPPPPPPPPVTVRVDLGDRAYPVLIGPAVLASAADALGRALGQLPLRAGLVVDLGAADHAARAERALASAGVEPVRVEVEPSERAKSLASLETILVALARARLERGEPVVAVGGGIVGDLAGFAAACYRRGVPALQCPTTLLAMVDASVGGKTGVNLDLGEAGGLAKNMAGAFHQPLAVLADIDTLATLPKRHLRAGLAECVKHALISADFGDAAYLDWIAASIDAILALDPDAVTELVRRSVQIKARVVAGDEREEARLGRALLNLGHTFAHAIETLPWLTPDGDPANAPLQHGEAVAVGLIAACRCSERLSLCDPSLGDEAEAILRRIGLPTRLAGLPDDSTLASLMGGDKKVHGGRLRLVLPTERGRATVVDDPPAHAVLAGIGAVRTDRPTDST